MLLKPNDFCTSMNWHIGGTSFIDILNHRVIIFSALSARCDYRVKKSFRIRWSRLSRFLNRFYTRRLSRGKLRVTFWQRNNDRNFQFDVLDRKQEKTLWVKKVTKNVENEGRNDVFSTNGEMRNIRFVFFSCSSMQNRNEGEKMRQRYFVRTSDS